MPTPMPPLTHRLQNQQIHGHFGVCKDSLVIGEGIEHDWTNSPNVSADPEKKYCFPNFPLLDFWTHHKWTNEASPYPGQDQCHTLPRWQDSKSARCSSNHPKRRYCHHQHVDCPMSRHFRLPRSQQKHARWQKCVERLWADSGLHCCHRHQPLCPRS